jgi:hypothetical protein
MQWEKPQLTTHGTVTQLTHGTKTFGTTDGWIFITGEGLQTVS